MQSISTTFTQVDSKDAIADNTEDKEGFRDRKKAYYFSKACVNTLTGVLAREKLVIIACCPVWVDTDMRNMVGKPPKTPQDATKIPTRLAFGDIGAMTGKYWATTRTPTPVKRKSRLGNKEKGRGLYIRDIQTGIIHRCTDLAQLHSMLL